MIDAPAAHANEPKTQKTAFSVSSRRVCTRNIKARGKNGAEPLRNANLSEISPHTNVFCLCVIFTDLFADIVGGSLRPKFLTQTQFSRAPPPKFSSVCGAWLAQ